eukprot:CAMPEP_0201122720 /NCGR_PEP_ID=MMETSP0850-20130426/6285_1 /ASSEMBLY_ACC=CAM_ASM_000622 /TAXON_ID=183588 /ORGANISM="Pseudo-nitzschia fraudulenta, Strain WWA7" /LENGTH=452 /DNA_ID=CAMNT_0047389465 /DNA_START=252 /DNA_END=1610 /DNA_ORIENTATION=-
MKKNNKQQTQQSSFQKESPTMSTVPSKSSTTISSAIGAVPAQVEANCHASSHGKRCNNQRHRSRTSITIPKEICFQSSSSVVSDLESEARQEQQPETIRTTITIPKEIRGKKEQRDYHNKRICLELLESERFDDNCVGMEHLVSITNHELVNSSTFLVDNNDKDDGSTLTSSIAYSLVYCNNNKHNEDLSKRLRAVFPSFLCESNHNSRTRRNRYGCKGDASETDNESSLSFSSSSLSSSYYSRRDMVGHQDHQGSADYYDQPRTSLKLPALRILVSSLELVTRTSSLSSPISSPSSSSSSHRSMNLLDGFWSSLLAYMTECLQDLVGIASAEYRQDCELQRTITQRNSNYQYQYHHNRHNDIIGSPASSLSIEAALVVKGVRLLHRLQPEFMSPYVRYSLLPFVSNARDFGMEQQQQQQQKGHHRRQNSYSSRTGDKMLVRECERLLKSFI